MPKSSFSSTVGPGQRDSQPRTRVQASSQ